MSKKKAKTSEKPKRMCGTSSKESREKKVKAQAAIISFHDKMMAEILAPVPPCFDADVRCSTCGGALPFTAKTLGTAADSVRLVEVRPCAACVDAKVNVIRAMM